MSSFIQQIISKETSTKNHSASSFGRKIDVVSMSPIPRGLLGLNKR